jgi:anthranilate phosphoribosyltransferase
MAGALAQLGLARGYVVHGSDGLDEITTTGPTSAFEIHGGKVQRRNFVPEDFGTSRVDAVALKGGDRETNAAIARAVLGGAAGPQREIVLVNAAAALVVAGKVVDFRQGMQMASASIDSGAARKKVKDLARFR